MNLENDKIKKVEKLTILEYISYTLAIIAVLIGLVSVFKTDFIAQHHEKALVWFVFALVAILMPYIREITLKDFHVVMNQMKVASEQLEGAAITAKELRNQLNATRDELIDGYQDLARPRRRSTSKVRVLTKVNHKPCS